MGGYHSIPQGFPDDLAHAVRSFRRLRNRITMNVLDDEGLLAGGIDSPESMGEHAGIRFNWAERTLGLAFATRQ